MSSNQRGTWGGKGARAERKLCTFLPFLVARPRLLSAPGAMAREIVYPRCESCSRKQNIVIVVYRRSKVATVSSPFPRSTPPRFFVSQPSDAQVSKYLLIREPTSGKIESVQSFGRRLTANPAHASSSLEKNKRKPHEG